MAYNISEEELLKRLVSDPVWCLFYHRSKVTKLLPSLAQAYILVGAIQKELITKFYEEKGSQDVNPNV